MSKTYVPKNAGLELLSSDLLDAFESHIKQVDRFDGLTEIEKHLERQREKQSLEKDLLL